MNDITAMTRAWFSQQDARLIIEATALCLKSQFVHSDVLGSTYQAIVGAGMGLTISCNLMDALVVWKFEQQLTRQAFLDKSQIYLYLRYRDDILVLSRSAAKLRRWLQATKTKLQYFKLEIE